MNVWLPDELAETIKMSLPSVNVSKVLQEGLRGLLCCTHEEYSCSACAMRIDKDTVIQGAKSQFYTQLLWELQDLVQAGGTAEGAARVAKGIAMAHQLPAASTPLPRPSRKARQRVEDRYFLENQGVA